MKHTLTLLLAPLAVVHAAWVSVPTAPIKASAAMEPMLVNL
jgi:hypothetical protein